MVSRTVSGVSSSRRIRVTSARISDRSRPRASKLHQQKRAITINDDARQLIRFAEDQAARFRPHAGAKRKGAAQPCFDQRQPLRVGLQYLPAHQPERDLRSRTVERGSQRNTALISDGNQAWGSADILFIGDLDHIRRIDPGMTCAQAVRSPSVHNRRANGRPASPLWSQRGARRQFWPSAAGSTAFWVLVMTLGTLPVQDFPENERPSAYNQAWRPRVQRRRTLTHPAGANPILACWIPGLWRDAPQMIVR